MSEVLQQNLKNAEDARRNAILNLNIQDAINAQHAVDRITNQIKRAERKASK